MNGISGFFKTSLIAVLAFGLLIALTSVSFADNSTWTGGGTAGDWSDVTNWDDDANPGNAPAAAPGPGEQATFDETSGNGYPTTNVPTDALNVVAESTAGNATITLPAMTINVLTMDNNNTANTVLLLFSGPVVVNTSTCLLYTSPSPRDRG